MHCRRFRIFALAFIVIITLTGQAGVLAQSSEQTARTGYALGAYDPYDQVENLSYPKSTPHTTLSPSQIDSVAEEIVYLINQERRAEGLYPYKVNPILTTVAEQHSMVMRDQDCFSHQCSGEPPVPNRACNAGFHPYGWGDCFTGETIAAGYGNPANVVAAWMASPGHRSILMHGELREIGVGYVQGGSYNHYWTTDFGSQPNILPVFINYDEPETDTRQVTLTLDNENVSGWGGIDFANQVMISNDPNFVGAQWEPYTLHKDWTLSPGYGQKTVYVKYRDSNGDEVVSVDDILHDGHFKLELNPDPPNFFYYKIGSGFIDSPQGKVQVVNVASDTPMDWTATDNKDWLTLNPTGGTTPDELLISVAAFTTDTPGWYPATVTVTSSQIPNDPKVMTITVVATEEIHRVMLPIMRR